MNNYESEYDEGDEHKDDKPEDDEDIENLYDIITKDLSHIEDLDDKKMYKIVSRTYYWVDYDFIRKIRWLFNLINNEEKNVKGPIMDKDLDYEFVRLFYEIVDIIKYNEDFPDSIPIDNLRKDTIIRLVNLPLVLGKIVYKYDYYFENKVINEFYTIEDILRDSMNNIILLPSDEIVIPMKNKTLRILNPMNNTYISLDHPYKYIYSIASIDRKIVSSYEGGELILWNLEDDTSITLQNSPSPPITEILSLGNRFITGSDQGDLKLWDLNGKILNTVKLESSINTLELLSNNRVIIGTGNGEIIIWDYITPKYTQWEAHMGSITHILVTNNETKIISAARDKNLKIWNLETQTLEETIMIGFINQMEFSSDGKYIIVNIYYDDDKYTQVYDLKGNLIRELFRPFGDISSIINLPDGRIVTGSGDNTDNIHLIQIWNLEVDVPDIVIRMGGIPTLFLLKDGSLTAVTDDGHVSTWK